MGYFFYRFGRLGLKSNRNSPELHPTGSSFIFVIPSKWKNARFRLESGAFCGATGRIWTGDLLITNQLLYRLSHSSTQRRAIVSHFSRLVNPLFPSCSVLCCSPVVDIFQKVPLNPVWKIPVLTWFFRFSNRGIPRLCFHNFFSFAVPCPLSTAHHGFSPVDFPAFHGQLSTFSTSFPTTATGRCTAFVLLFT